MEEQKPSFLQGDAANNQQTAAQSAAEAQRLSEEAKIREILAEQQKLQQLYNEVVVYIQQHPNMPTEEMIKYQTQLKQLSDYYQKNQERLKTLGYSSVQVNKNVVIKKGAKRNVSIKELFI
jgi:oligoendopeptidase F